MDEIKDLPSQKIVKSSTKNDEKENTDKFSNSALRVPAKKMKLGHSTEQHCLVSCIYIAEVDNGESPAAEQTSVVNFRSSNALSSMMNPSISPLIIQSALARPKASLLAKREYLKCLNCDNEATLMCSSIVMSQAKNKSLNVAEKFQVLNVSEHLICSCNDVGCRSAARRKRNHSAEKKDVHGYGFNFAFRCALKPLGRDLDAPHTCNKNEE